MMVSSLPTPPFKRWEHFNFEKLKSFGGSPYWEHSDNGNQRRGGGHNSGQNNYHTIAFFFQGKTTFMITFKEKIVLIFITLVLKPHMQTVV